MLTKLGYFQDRELTKSGFYYTFNSWFQGQINKICKIGTIWKEFKLGKTILNEIRHAINSILPCQMFCVTLFPASEAGNTQPTSTIMSQGQKMNKKAIMWWSVGRLPRLKDGQTPARPSKFRRKSYPYLLNKSICKTDEPVLTQLLKMLHMCSYKILLSNKWNEAKGYIMLEKIKATLFGSFIDLSRSVNYSKVL